MNDLDYEDNKTIDISLVNANKYIFDINSNSKRSDKKMDEKNDKKSNIVNNVIQKIEE